MRKFGKMTHAKGLVFGHVPGQKRNKKQLARVEGACEKNSTFLSLRVCVFGINCVLHAKMRQNDAHKKNIFLAVSLPKKDIKRHFARARKI